MEHDAEPVRTTSGWGFECTCGDAPEGMPDEDTAWQAIADHLALNG